jgi:sugar phosphate isomerase/epimerase
MKTPSRRQFLQTAGALPAVGLASSATVPAAPQTPPAPRRFQLGLVTYNLAATWDLPTILRVCRAVGLAAVELRTGHRHGVEPSLTPAQRREVRQRFADAGILCWGCGTTCEFHAPNPAEVQRNIDLCRRFLDLAADIGGRGVKVRPNAMPAGVPVARTLEQIGRALATCGRAAAERGLEVWLEVHGPGTAHPPHIRTILEHCQHPAVGITWNSNPTDVVRGSVREYFTLLRPWIRSCHINELYSVYPYRELFRLLRDTGYDRVTLAEIPGMPDVSSGERLLRYYKALWNELAS